jgi:CO dehydrogenase maturation factor
MMKVAVAGKGGSGKTTIAGTLARVMADRGHRVVAIDDDSNPNLALTLGAGAAASSGPGLPRDLLEERTDAQGNKRLELSIPADDFIERFGVVVGEHLTLLVMGQPDHGGSG